MKIWAYGVIILALLASAWKAYDVIDTAGYDRAVLELQEQQEAIRDRAVKDAIADWEASQIVAGNETDVEIRIVEKIRIVEREIPKIIERFIEVKPECSDLSELAGVFNQQVEGANTRPGSAAEDTG